MSGENHVKENNVKGALTLNLQFISFPNVVTQNGG